MYQSTTGYSSINVPLKKEQKDTSRALFYGFSAVVLLVLSAYFIYSGYFGEEIPLIAFLTSSNKAQSIRIEYNLEDERAVNLVPNTQEWISFHDDLITEAGFDATALRANPEATVTFVAYDYADEETSIVEADIEADYGSGMSTKRQRKKEGKDKFSNQNRPTFGISCYTEYTEVGVTNSNMCNPTRKIANPIRTGCSSLSAGGELSGVTMVNEFECASPNENERVSARCCQPTPDTEYVSSAWSVTAREKKKKDTCLDIGCHDGEVLTGCSGTSTGKGKKSEEEELEADYGMAPMSAFGGTKLFKNECTVQQSGTDTLFVQAMCAKQEEDATFSLDCQAVNAEGALREGDDFVSSVQCPVDYTMFDCSSFHETAIGMCVDSDNTDQLFGEYYFKEKAKSKAFCKAVSESAEVRAQAICCGLF